jgi:predicted CoA-binding protein
VLAKDGRRIDIVDCFRKSEDIPPVAKDAIDVRASVLWMQLGIENQVAADLARAAGLEVVMNHCMLVEHRRMEAGA